MAQFFGWLLSLLFTLTAYFLAARGGADKALLWTLAGGQIAAQGLFFFDLGKKGWGSLFFLAMIVVAVLIVGGSLWILSSLAERMAMP